jgi:hypothetical protein
MKMFRAWFENYGKCGEAGFVLRLWKSKEQVQGVTSWETLVLDCRVSDPWPYIKISLYRDREDIDIEIPK